VGDCDFYTAQKTASGVVVLRQGARTRFLAAVARKTRVYANPREIRCRSSFREVAGFASKLSRIMGLPPWGKVPGTAVCVRNKV
jgi:hypothetical protein